MRTDPIRSLARSLAGLTAALVLALAMPAGAQEEDGGRMTGIKLSSDEPINIESDRLEVFENEGRAVFTGNVNVVQGNTTMRSAEMTVFYENEGGGSEEPSSASAGPAGSSDIERIEVEGGVYVKSENQVATGDAGTFDMDTEVLTLTGDEVVLSEGENVIVGCKLTVQMTTGRARLDGCATAEGGTGRVKMLLQPGSQD